MLDIEANIRAYLYGDGQTGGINPTERYASFDYCFNYFQFFFEQRHTAALADKEQLPISCLQLGFYLASWGMLRGSSFLLSKSVKVYEDVIKVIAHANPIWWTIDVDSYTPSNIDHLLECYRMIGAAFGSKYTPSDTLITKIMLGVFGNVPAFDSYFRYGFGVNTFGRNSLVKVGHFYEHQAPLIEKYRIQTLDVVTGQHTTRRYTRAKVMDMIFFIEGGKTPASGQLKT